MDQINSQLKKNGRAAMPVGPVSLLGSDDVKLKAPSFGGAGRYSRSRLVRKVGANRHLVASTERLSGLVFIATRTTTRALSALKGTDVVVSDASPVRLKSGEAVEAFFCVVSDSAFDTLLRDLRETCLKTKSSGAVFFGGAKLPDQLSLQDLSRLTRLTDIRLDADNSQSSFGSEQDCGRWFRLSDLSYVRFGQDCPEVGPDFPCTVGLRIQDARLN